MYSAYELKLPPNDFKLPPNDFKLPPKVLAMCTFLIGMNFWEGELKLQVIVFKEKF